MSALSAAAAASGNAKYQVWFGPRTVTINLTFATLEDVKDAMDLATTVIEEATRREGRSWFEDQSDVRILVEEWHDAIIENEIGASGMAATGGKKFLEENAKSWCAGCGDCPQGGRHNEQNCQQLELYSLTIIIVRLTLFIFQLTLFIFQLTLFIFQLAIIIVRLAISRSPLQRLSLRWFDSTPWCRAPALWLILGEHVRTERGPISAPETGG
ncbi:unnamed protein product [Sympodiomycopsis kandeliae]